MGGKRLTEGGIGWGEAVSEGAVLGGGKRLAKGRYWVGGGG